MAIATMPMHLEHLEREEPGVHSSAVLAILVHVLLFAVLFFGVRWQSRPPETVSVELWVPPPPPVVERVEVKPEPVVEPPPPPPPPKPEPRIEVPKPDIVIKAKPEPKPKPKPEPVKPKPEPVKPKHEPVKPKHEPPPKPHPKPEAVKPRPEPVKPPPQARPRDEEMQRRMREELAQEQNSLKIDRERQNMKEQLARDMAAAQKSALSGYAEKIKGKVRGNIVMPLDIKGNPEAIFVVIQLPTGEVLSAKLRKSSGNPAYDTAVERAILKSSPLPKPDKGELFERELILKFHPHD